MQILSADKITFFFAEKNYVAKIAGYMFPNFFFFLQFLDVICMLRNFSLDLHFFCRKVKTLSISFYKKYILTAYSKVYFHNISYWYMYITSSCQIQDWYAVYNFFLQNMFALSCSRTHFRNFSQQRMLVNSCLKSKHLTFTAI